MPPTQRFLTMPAALVSLDQFTPPLGVHGESAGLRNVAELVGVVDPRTGEPLSEALCFGIAGGIAAGYSFCPSISGHAVGSGVALVGRYRYAASDGTFQREFCHRLGLPCDVRETTGAKAALTNLLDPLTAGQPVIVWCGTPGWCGVGWSCSVGMTSLVVLGFDEAKNQARVADVAPRVLHLPGEELAQLRGAVCSHKQRTMTIKPAAPLTAPQLKSAALSGIQACAEDFLRPKLKTYNLPGLLELAKAIASETNKKGWPRVFAKGKLYQPLRDAYASIETASTTGGLLRPLYAEFLDEAAELTNRPALRNCAARYRDLAGDWTRLAHAMLPSRVAPLKRTRQLLLDLRKAWLRKTSAADKRRQQIMAELMTIEREQAASFALDQPAMDELLTDLQQQLLALHAAETTAAEMLAQAAN